MTKIFHSITDLIGNTPIVKLNKVVPEGVAEVYVKLEYFNPGSSVKDRVALGMIEKAEKEGLLNSGDTIVEPTSGNTGIGLAMVGAAKGYKVELVMPDTMSIERRKLMQAYGGKLLLTPGVEGMKGAIAKATELAQQPGYFMPLQFDNLANPEIHEKTTAKEIQQAFGVSGLAAFVAGVGTGGTITGIGHELKRVYENIDIIAVEPQDSPVLEGGKPGPHKIQGIGAGFIPKILDTKVYNKIISVANEQAFEMARRLGIEEGILAGISAGAAVQAAVEVATGLEPDQKVLAIIPDNGERYLSTTLYDL